MMYRSLGSSELMVSRVCLGTMTWGLQNTQDEAEYQIEYALSQGVNFIDTAEMYAVPPSPDTYGKTETIIGKWLAKNQMHREEIILASKIAGPGMPWVRNGEPITPKDVMRSVDASLTRLQTDYIDLYQIHWPRRSAPHFNNHHPADISLEHVDVTAEMEDMRGVLEALQECVVAGKIRHCGLSNETPWGLEAYLRLSREYDLPRMVSMQNEFSLLHAKDWPYMIESCHHNNVAYLPWSPLGGGMLSGKYQDGAIPEGSRWSMRQRNGIFRDTVAGHAAVRAYGEIAKAHGVTTAQLALAWCYQVEGVTSTIIGATTMVQLKENLAVFLEPLSAEIMEAVGLVLREYPQPY